MKTIWFCGNNEEKLTTIAEIVGELLIGREKNVELIVYSEVKEILGSGLKEDEEGKNIFADRLGFLGKLLHRNNTFALIVAIYPSIESRKKVKDNYGNYIQINMDKKDPLTDILINEKDDIKISAKQIFKSLIDKKIISSDTSGADVYSEDEEEEIRRRLEELGYV